MNGQLISSLCRKTAIRLSVQDRMPQKVVSLACNLPYRNATPGSTLKVEYFSLYPCHEYFLSRLPVVEKRFGSKWGPFWLAFSTPFSTFKPISCTTMKIQQGKNGRRIAVALLKYCSHGLDC
nr:endonuclease 4-like [Ipomoea batatas]